MPGETKLYFPPNTRFWRAISWASISTVGSISKLWLLWLNRFHCHNQETLHKVLYRPPGVPLITVMNHASCLDDPCLWGSLPLSFLIGINNIHHLRWSLGATDICFTNDLHSKFFLTGKTLPCVRGGGVYQTSMDYVLDRLNHGDWLHIFPEGKVNMNNEELRLKWGIGRLISECKLSPIVLPIWHCGMDTVLPNFPPYIPRIGKIVTMYVGEPLDFSCQVAALRRAKKSSMEMRKELTDVIQLELALLKEKAERMHRKRLKGSFP